MQVTQRWEASVIQMKIDNLKQEESNGFEDQNYKQSEEMGLNCHK